MRSYDECVASGSVDRDCCSAEFFKQCPELYDRWYPEHCPLHCIEPKKDMLNPW